MPRLASIELLWAPFNCGKYCMVQKKLLREFNETSPDRSGGLHNVAKIGKSCTCPRVHSRAKVPINMNSVIFF
jgi:hypothetical protein